MATQMHSHKTSSHALYPWLVLQHSSISECLATIHQLLERFKHPQAIIDADPSVLTQYGLSGEQLHSLKHPNQKAIEQELQWQEATAHFIIPRDHPSFPALLKEIARPPFLLYVIGKCELLNAPQIAIVGSRRATAIGIEHTHSLAESLSQLGLTVTSGMALGIDGAAHRGALKATGNTIAVLGNGLHHCYPRRHRALAHEIARHGAVISEAPLNTLPQARLFPKRNRIISGLSLGTVVAEASLKSGSLITAKRALEQNREVFAIPGSISNSNAKGTNTLIQQGAKLIEKATDIIEEIPYNPPLSRLQDKNFADTTPETIPTDAKKLLKTIDFASAPIEQIASRAQQSVQKISSLLLILELHGYIRWVNGFVTRIK